MEDKNVIPEIVRVDIKTEIVKEEPIEAEDSFVECETCKENSTSEKDCAHRPSDRLGLPRGECRTNVSDPEEDVKPKVEPDDRESLSDDLIDKLIESGVTEKEENYHDVPEILPEDTDFLRTEIKMEEVDIDSVKDELDNNEASISSEALGQEEDSNENPKPGPSEEAKKVGDLKKKWNNLRDTYSKELKKIPKPHSGDSPSNYEPAGKYFTLLGFFKDEYMPLAAESNLDEGDSGIIDKEDNDDMSIEVINEVRSPSRASSPIEPSTSNSQNSKRRQNIQDNRAQYLEIEKKKVKLSENDMSKNKPVDSEKKSGDYHFLMSILPEMEKLPTIQKIRLRNKINQALLDEINVTMYGDPYGRYGY
nr:uncharacterized protein LOC111511532 isoform X7 [Leptinotarsa decemlineata]